MLMLSENDVRQLLTMEDAIKAVQKGLLKLGLDEGENIPRSRVRTDHAMLHMMSAASKTVGYLGYKAYITTQQGAHFVVGLYDAKDGSMAALIQADYLGQVRTGAATGVATKRLARKDATTVGILGTGKQARAQLEAICQVREITRVQAYSPTPENRTAFATEMSERCNTEVVVADNPEAAVRGMDIIVTATSAREPVLRGEWVSQGAHINLIGSNFRGKAEADVSTIKACEKVFVDSKDQARIEAGDLFPAIDAGALEWSRVYDLGQILTGRISGRDKPDEITLFKSVGLAIEDVAVASVVYEKAKEQGIGKTWEW